VIATTLYRGLARPLFRALSGAAEIAITKVLIKAPANGFYSLDSNFVGTNDYSLKAFFFFDGNVIRIFGNNSNFNGRVLVQANGSINFRAASGTSGSALGTPTGVVPLNKWSSIEVTRVGSTGRILINNFQVVEGTVNTGAINCNVILANGSVSEGGTIADVEMSDITTTSNSLAFSINDLTASTEINNGVTLTYNAIPVNVATRDTYTLENSGSELVGSLRTLDVSPQSLVTGYDVILLVGQSNMVGSVGPVDSVLDATDPRILQFGNASQAFSLAQDPLDNFNITGNTVGMGMSIAKAHLATLPATRGVILVPSAKGSTGFGDGFWLTTGQGYTKSIASANIAINYSGLNNSLVLIAWQHGENDQPMTESQYATPLDALISGFRSNITGASSIRFIVGQVPTWSTSYGAGVNAALAATPARVTNTAYITTSDLTDGVGGDGIHFDPASQRTLGARYASEM
jgi:hypothetical protein